MPQRLSEVPNIQREIKIAIPETGSTDRPRFASTQETLSNTSPNIRFNDLQGRMPPDLYENLRGQITEGTPQGSYFANPEDRIEEIDKFLEGGMKGVRTAGDNEGIGQWDDDTLWWHYLRTRETLRNYKEFKDKKGQSKGGTTHKASFNDYDYSGGQAHETFTSSFEDY